MNYYKKSLKTALCSALIFSAYFVIAAYIHDPLQIFHKPLYRKTTFTENMREQALGIIKHYDFDSIILGNSLFENTSGHEADEKIGGNFVNLSTSGVRYFERYKILKYALAQKKINNVILQLDAYLNTTDTASAAFVPEAYDDSISGQIKLYINTKYAGCIASLSNSKKCVGTEKDLKMPTPWGNSPEHAKLFGGYVNWLKHKTTNDLIILKNSLKNENPINISYDELEKMKNLVRGYVVEIVKNNQKTNFHIIVPPYSLLFWKNPIEHGINLESYKEVVKTLLWETKNLNNVAVYWFYDNNFVEDMSKYKDLSHYSPEINSLFVDAVAKRENILTYDNFDKNFSRLEHRVKNFDSSKYFDLLQTELKNRL